MAFFPLPVPSIQMLLAPLGAEHSGRVSQPAMAIGMGYGEHLTQGAWTQTVTYCLERVRQQQNSEVFI